MYVVTKVEIEEYDSCIARIEKSGVDYALNGEKIVYDMSAEIEEIKGLVYVLPNGNELMVGLSEEVRTVLGIPLETIENMDKKIEELHEARIDENINAYNKIYRLEKQKNALTKSLKRISKFKDMSLLNRLIFLFTNKINHIK